MKLTQKTNDRLELLGLIVLGSVMFLCCVYVEPESLFIICKDV